MAKANIDTIYKEILELSNDEKVILLSRLMLEVSQHLDRDRKVSFYDIKGVGKEIWKGIDAQEYVDKERESWK